MGHRCNYAIVDERAVTVYRSQWGALYLWRNFMWGLELSRSFLRTCEPCDDDHLNGGWYDEVDGEGAIVIDEDRRVVTLCGGALDGEPRRLALEVMRALWAADQFTVREVETVVEVAAVVGVPASAIEHEHAGCAPLDVDDPRWSGRGGVIGCLIAIDDQLRFCRSDLSVLEAGPAMLPALARLPGWDEAAALCAVPSIERIPITVRDRDGGELVEIREITHEPCEFPDALTVLCIDTARRRIEASRSALGKGASRRHFARLWPGWTLENYDDELAAMRKLGVRMRTAPPPPLPSPTPAEAWALLAQHLFADDEPVIADVMEMAAELRAWPDALGPRAEAAARLADVRRMLGG